MLVQHFLENTAARLPDKTALICGQERLSYREINGRANFLAHLLKSLGVERQDRVAILLDSSIESVVSLYAILKADAIFLMLSPTMKVHKLNYILNDCGVKVLITHPSKTEVVKQAVLRSPTVKHILWAVNNTWEVEGGDSVIESQRRLLGRWVVGSEEELIASTEAVLSSFALHLSPLSSNIDLDLATIIYTSGTTGNPKGVMLSHLNMVSAINSITQYLENDEDDIIMNTLPLSFDYGLYQILMAFTFGGTVILEQSFAYPFKIIQRMMEEKVTGFPGVPTIFAILLSLKNPEKIELPYLRYITNTAAALPPAHIEQLAKLFPHVRIYSMYGLTECKRVSYLPPEDIHRKPSSVGFAMPNTEVWIEDENGQRVIPGIVGELVVRGSNVMRGYWGLPEETARVLKSGSHPGEVVLHTGDLFKTDNEGYLYFMGRKDDMIKSRGERISPKEIEQCLCELEGVSEAVVIGIPDDILGQAIVAYIRCSADNKVSEKSIMKHCQENLEDFMVPREVRFIEEFPKNSNGKIDKYILFEMVTINKAV